MPGSSDRLYSNIEYFDRYALEATQWMQVSNLKHRRAAIRRSDEQLEALDGIKMMSALSACLDGPWWGGSGNSRGRNWEWRKSVPPYKTKSREVKLERALAERSQSRWTCQMSTSSGLRTGHAEGRRSIDLVCRTDADIYKLIELKVNSDHPFYALFEILGYGLCYLLARRSGSQGRGQHDVMTARRIELVVMAPEGWYNFKRSPADQAFSRFDFRWLIEKVNAGLAAHVQLLALPGVGFPSSCHF